MHSVIHTASQPITHLQKRQVFSLIGKPGQRLEVRSGEVWVTQDGDPRDLVLGAHQCFTLDRSGKVLVSALRDASFAFRTEAPPLPRVRAHASAVPAAVAAGCY